MTFSIVGVSTLSPFCALTLGGTTGSKKTPAAVTIQTFWQLATRGTGQPVKDQLILAVNICD